jgi:hypothetical protein
MTEIGALNLKRGHFYASEAGLRNVTFVELMKRQRHIAWAIFGIAILLSRGPLLHADPDGLIDPGVPQVHPSDSVTPTSFDHLIPTSVPTIVVTPPTVPASSDNLVHPTDQPLVPQGTN